jgi:hypothetical protein
VLRYLGRYTHCVAISNHRLIAFDGERITFRWKDYAHDGQRRTMTLTAMEFLRRFVQHVAWIFRAACLASGLSTRPDRDSRLHSRPPRQRLPSSLVIESVSASASV